MKKDHDSGEDARGSNRLECTSRGWQRQGTEGRVALFLVQLPSDAFTSVLSSTASYLHFFARNFFLPATAAAAVPVNARLGASSPGRPALLLLRPLPLFPSSSTLFLPLIRGSLLSRGSLWHLPGCCPIAKVLVRQLRGGWSRFDESPLSFYFVVSW